MSKAGFAYAQARLHARLEYRLTESDWRMLAASRDFGNCLDVVNQTSAAGVTSRLDRTSSIHAVERVLREEWSAIVNETASWVDGDWQPAIVWMTVLPHLRRFEYSPDEGIIPRWLRLSAEFPDIAGMLLPTHRLDIAGFWREEWCAKMPGKRQNELICTAMAPLLDRYLDGAGVVALSASKQWQQLSDLLKRLFRRHPQTPLAVFAFLGMVALDFERLRGVFADRILFANFAEPEVV